MAAPAPPRPGCKGLTALECDELEFEGLAAAGEPLGLTLEGLTLLCVVGTLALVLARAAQRLLSNRARRRQLSTTPLKSPASPAAWKPAPSPLRASTGAGPGPSRLPLSPLQPRPAAAAAAHGTPTGFASVSPGLQHQPLSPRSLSPPANSASSLRFSLSPGWKAGAGLRSPALLRAPSGLLRQLAALGRKLGLTSKAPALWGGARSAAGQPGAEGPTPSPRSRRYGLGLGEAESEDEDSDDEVTAQALRTLQQSPEFQQYLRGRGLTSSDVARTASKLRLYRRLRQLDPAGFWLLVNGSAARTFDTQDPPMWAVVLEYLLSLGANLAAVAAVCYAWSANAAPAAARAAALVAAWWLTGAAWVRGRSAGGRLLGMWYEELRWGHSAPLWRVAAANAAELVWVVFTGGVPGAAVSLWLRCWRGAGGGGWWAQSMGERCGGVRQVREVELPTALLSPRGKKAA